MGDDNDGDYDVDTSYRSVVLFIPLGVIVLALMISFCSLAIWLLLFKQRMQLKPIKIRLFC